QSYFLVPRHGRGGHTSRPFATRTKWQEYREHMKRHAPEQYLNYKRHQREAQARYRAKLKARRHMALSMGRRNAHSGGVGAPACQSSGPSVSSPEERVHAMSTFRHALHARGGGGQMSRRTHNQLYREYLKRHKPDQYLRYKKQQKEACQRYREKRRAAENLALSGARRNARDGGLGTPIAQSSGVQIPNPASRSSGVQIPNLTSVQVAYPASQNS
ncbi:hypothetical protein BaRGS_00027516, partial [Batillaria attramentaria]